MILQVIKVWLWHDTQLGSALCFMKLKGFYVYMHICNEGLMPQSLQPQAQVFWNHMQVPQTGRMREVACAFISVFLQSERWRCQYWLAYVAAAIKWLR